MPDFKPETTPMTDGSCLFLACQIEPLPERIPEEFYAAKLEGDEEKAAFQKLLEGEGYTPAADPSWDPSETPFEEWGEEEGGEEAPEGEEENEGEDFGGEKTQEEPQPSGGFICQQELKNISV